VNIYSYTGNDLPTGATVKQAVGSWEYQSCYRCVIAKLGSNMGSLTGHSDSIDSRTLSPRVWVDGQMTIEKCVNKCFQGGFMYAGLEYANVCPLYSSRFAYYVLNPLRRNAVRRQVSSRLKTKISYQTAQTPSAAPPRHHRMDAAW
jgi:hypothetical protein